MLSRVLFPTDLSSYSKAILCYLPDFKKVGVEEIDVLFVINTNKISTVSGGIDIEKYIESETREAEKSLSGIVKLIESQGIKSKVIRPFPVGDPVSEILKYSENYDLIVIGSRGRGIIKEIFLGSVSEGVIRKSKVPVFVFKFKVAGNVCVKCHPNLFERVLVAYDFSKHSEKALRYARYVVEKSNGNLYVVHAPENGKEVEIEDAEVIIRKGTPAKVILGVAEEINATSIFIGSRGLSPLESIILGSTSDVVIRRANVPVFVCRE